MRTSCFYWRQKQRQFNSREKFNSYLMEKSFNICRGNERKLSLTERKQNRKFFMEYKNHRVSYPGHFWTAFFSLSLSDSCSTFLSIWYFKSHMSIFFAHCMDLWLNSPNLLCVCLHCLFLRLNSNFTLWTFSLIWCNGYHHRKWTWWSEFKPRQSCLHFT